MAKIIVNPGTVQAFELELKQGMNSLGRAPENDLVIDHESVSRRHCEIAIGDSEATLFDLESEGGTFVDGVAIEQAALSEGRHFRMGQVALQFCASNPSETTAEIREADSPGSKGTFCRYHSKSPARYHCAACAKSYCALCVGRQFGGGRSAVTCRQCGSVCAELASIRDEPKAMSLAEAVCGGFKYPLEKDAWLLLAGGTLFYLFLGFLERGAGFAGPYGIVAGLMIAVFGGGYMVAFMQRIVTTSAMGEESGPGWPDFSNWQEDIVGPLLQMGCILAFCFWPVVLGRFLIGSGNPLHALVIGAWVLGLAYLPMAILAVFMADSVTALNPLIVVPAIVRLGIEYWVVCGLLGAMVVMASAIKGGLATLLPVPLLPAVVSGFASFYLLTAAMRLLGLMHWRNKARLGWFRDSQVS